MKRIALFSLCLLVCCAVCVGCDPKKVDPPPPPGQECTAHRACWKKICTDSDPDKYKACVIKELKLQDDKGGDKSPNYHTCNAENKCTVLPAGDLGDGTVEVAFPEATKLKIAKDQVKWLRLYIFPPKDLDGKDITCSRLKESTDKELSSLMSLDWGRYYPPPAYDKPITTDVIRVGDTMDLLFQPAVVPQGAGRVFVVQGFCNPPEGRPTLDTKHKWWACKEGVDTKAGKESNKVGIELPVQNDDRCPTP